MRVLVASRIPAGNIATGDARASGKRAGRRRPARSSPIRDNWIGKEGERSRRPFPAHASVRPSVRARAPDRVAQRRREVMHDTSSWLQQESAVRVDVIQPPAQLEVIRGPGESRVKETSLQKRVAGE